MGVHHGHGVVHVFEISITTDTGGSNVGSWRYQATIRANVDLPLFRVLWQAPNRIFTSDQEFNI